MPSGFHESLPDVRCAHSSKDRRLRKPRLVGIPVGIRDASEMIILDFQERIKNSRISRIRVEVTYIMHNSSELLSESACCCVPDFRELSELMGEGRGGGDGRALSYYRGDPHHSSYCEVVDEVRGA
jgi:hypothetical protein